MRLDHVAFLCRDEAATAKFYGELLALPLTRFSHAGATMLLFALPAGGTLVFTIGAAPSPTPRSAWQQQHVGLVVRDAAELDRWLQRLRAHSIPHELLDGDRLYFADPDGHVLELEVAS